MNSSTEIDAFYVSWRWRKCRIAFAKSKGNICEECLARGIIEAGSKDRPLEVHHKIPLTPENIHDPKVTLNWDNLQLLCKTCHEAKKDKKPKRWRVDQDGKVFMDTPL